MDSDATVVTDQEKYHPSYNSPDADLILLSDDGIKFRAHSLILSKASKFFREMFELPRPEQETQEDAIPIGESSLVTKAMLDIIYPGESDASLPTRGFRFFRRLLSAAERFRMMKVNDYVRLLTQTPRFDNKPLEVYALACPFGWDNEARWLSLKTLSLDLTNRKYANILKALDGNALYNLFEVRWVRRRQILSVTKKLERTPIDEIGGCDCDEEDQPHIEEDEWKILTSYICEKLDKRADGNFLKEYKFWDDGRLKGLWERTCDHCGDPCVTIDGFQEFFAGALDTIASKDK